MKPIKFLYLILAFRFCQCTPDNPRLTHYKIEEFYVNAYKLNTGGSNIDLGESISFSAGDSVFIGMTFKISYCDSIMTVCKYDWNPTRGGHGIANKIKKFFILAKSENVYDTIWVRDLKLVTDSLNYFIKNDKHIEARVNSRSRPGCRQPLDELIRRINAGHRCYNRNSLNGANLLYYLNTQKLSNGNNQLEFCLEFEDYILKKKIYLRFG